MSESIDSGIEIPSPTPPESRVTGLVVTALIIPALTGVVLCFVTSFDWAVGISLICVGVTSVLVAIDAYQLGNVDRSGRQRAAPWLLFLGMCAFWIIFYPFAFFRRRDFVRPNLGIPALIVALMYLGLPIGRWLLVPAGLPACDSREVAALLEQIVRQSPAGAKLQSIDGYREVAFDREAGRRQGQAIAHLTGGDVPIHYTVAWRDRAGGMFEVRIPPPDLPACTSAEVQRLLEQVIRGQTLGAKAKSIDDNREVSYDRDADLRTCQCTVHLEIREVVVKYTVGWRDRAKGEFEVRLAEPDLPACDSKDVIRVIDKLVREAPEAPKFRSIDGHRELSYDSKAERREGQCVVHVEEGDHLLEFVVEWKPNTKYHFQVRITGYKPTQKERGK